MAESYPPGTYCILFQKLQQVAKTRGYALAVHGSMKRDMDVMAMPWIEDAVSPEVLIEALREACGGYIIPDGTEGGRFDAEQQKFVAAVVRNPERKPHGRLAWNIPLGAGPFIDVSVMPPTPAAPEAAANPYRVNDTGTAIEWEDGKLGCLDCRLPYGDEYGFPDLVIDDEAWEAISPNHDEGGLLCPSCICRRLYAAGIETTGRFTSGPLAAPSAPEAAAERVYEWQGRRCVIRHYQDTAVWIGDDANENWSRFYLSKDGEWKDALPPKVTVFDSWPTRQSALAFLENLKKGTPQ